MAKLECNIKEDRFSGGEGTQDYKSQDGKPLSEDCRALKHITWRVGRGGWWNILLLVRSRARVTRKENKVRIRLKISNALIRS